MAEVLGIFTMFMKVMFAGAGAIVAFLVFCIMVYLAVIVIKSALQAVFEIAFEMAEMASKKFDEIWESMTKKKGKKKRE